MRSMTKTIAILLVSLGTVLGLTACEEGRTDSVKAEQQIRNGAYDRLAQSQPAKTMQFSPTRETINFWVDTWDEPGKLSYVYLQSPEGKLLGYYVLKGLPVSYCSALAPNYEIDQNDYGKVVLPAPGLDGTYEASGAACNTYYGQDATTGAYVEYTAGFGINVLLYDKPMPQFVGAIPLGDTK